MVFARVCTAQDQRIKLGMKYLKNKEHFGCCVDTNYDLNSKYVTFPQLFIELIES